jgi:hypothetical protein
MVPLRLRNARSLGLPAAPGTVADQKCRQHPRRKGTFAKFWNKETLQALQCVSLIQPGIRGPEVPASALYRPASRPNTRSRLASFTSAGNALVGCSGLVTTAASASAPTPASDPGPCGICRIRRGFAPVNDPLPRAKFTVVKTARNSASGDMTITFAAPELA